MKNAKKAVPRWETAVLAASFALVWAWFLARQAAYRGGAELSVVWNAILLLAVAALVAVLVRRLKRALAALREVHPAQRGRDRN